MRSFTSPRVLSTVVATVVIAGLVLVAPSVVADTAPPVVTTPSTVSTDVLPTVQIDGVVWDQEIAGNTVFAGGDFQKARPAGAAPGTNTIARRYLLSYNLQTGVMNASWNPNPNARIRNMAISPDGSRLYVVGSFTSIAGATRYRVAAFDTATGNLTSFRPVLNGKVNAVAATNSTVYLVGGFTVADGASVSGAVAYDAVTGVRKANWVPQITEGQAIAATVKSDGSRVVIGGYFKKVNGSSNPGYGLAMLDGITATMLPFNVNSKVRNAGDNAAISSLHSDANGVYGTGQHYGTGTLEGTFYANWTDGGIIWIEDCHGDTYSVYPGVDAVYTASHAHYCGNIGGFPQTNPWGFHRGLAFTKSVQGVITKDPLGYTNWAGTPRPALLHWFPDINTGTFTGVSQGAWSVAGNNQYILYGGEFTVVNNIKQQGIARFAVASIAPNKDGPRLSGADYTPAVTSPADRTAKVSWKANWDRDNTKLTYDVIRNGNTIAPVYSTTANSNFWTLPSMTFTDTTVTGGLTYTYRIRATDPFGNVVNGNNVSVVIKGTGTNPGARAQSSQLTQPELLAPLETPVSAYAARVVGDSPTVYWRLGETAGRDVNDTMGAMNADANSGVEFGIDGAIERDSDKSAAFDGVNGLVATKSPVDAPKAFAVEAWFNTAASTGGMIIGFGNARAGESDASGRQLYLDGSGRAYLGLDAGLEGTLHSPAGLNDGRWHHIVGNLGPSGAQLYVDGTLADERTDATAAGNFAGYWRIGGDRTWAGDAYFNGSIDDVAVYPAPLTTEQVSSHYAASGR